ncbi:MAG: (d)CMP kinase [Planctomycetota bacterium]
MIVTIDGPAGAGKSTVTRRLARQLGFQFLDTGAMYRAVTLIALQRQVDLQDAAALVHIAKTIEIRFDDDRVFVDDEEVTQAIRDLSVARNVGKIADQPEVREHLVQLQRRIANEGNFVCEGRDQGTVAFPDSFCKIYLTASKQSRAARRFEQLQASGRFADYDQVVRDQEVRDHQDATRPIGKLQRAVDAIEVNTDRQTLDEVVDTLEQIVRQRMDQPQPKPR